MSLHCKLWDGGALEGEHDEDWHKTGGIMMKQEVGILIAILIHRGCLIKFPQYIYLLSISLTQSSFLPLSKTRQLQSQFNKFPSRLEILGTVFCYYHHIRTTITRPHIPVSCWYSSLNGTSRHNSNTPPTPESPWVLPDGCAWHDIKHLDRLLNSAAVYN